MGYPDPALVKFVRSAKIEEKSFTHALAESAIEHRVAPLLLDSMEDSGAIDRDVASLLTAVDLAMEARGSALVSVMTKVHLRLVDLEVPHTFFKGATAAARWFDKPKHRPYADIDVLVPSPDFRRAIAGLDEAHPLLSLPAADLEQYFSTVVLLIDGVGVDVQTDALRTGLGPVDSMSWAVGTDQVAIREQVNVPALDTEHDLVMFLLHQGRDRFRYLLGVAEAARRLKAEIDWEIVESIARKEGIWEQVGVALEVLCDELGQSTPIKMPTGWRVALWRYLWRPKVRLLGPIGHIKHIRRARWLMPLTMKGRAADTLKWILRSAFPPDHVLRLRSPEATGPYLWRLVASRLVMIGTRRARALRSPTGKRGETPT
jgi:hypothetical protein